MRKYIDYIKYKYTENEKYFCINGWCLDKDNKIVYKVEINGKEINTETITSTGQSRQITIERQPDGAHIFEIYVNKIVLFIFSII